VLSLQNARVAGGEFIGLGKLRNAAADPVFITGRRQHESLYATIVVAAQITLASFVASLNSRSDPGRTSSTARSSTCPS